MNEFNLDVRLELRALNISGVLHVAVQEGGHPGPRAGYDSIRQGLEALGFRVQSDEGALDALGQKP